jgi:hypothetical protein
VFLAIERLLFHGITAMRPVFPKTHFGLVSEDAIEPGRELGSSLKLMQVFEGGKQAVLEQIFRIFRGANQTAGRPYQFGHASGEKFVEL